jgi:hypothetical protein
VRRWLLIVLAAAAACGGNSQTKADQGRSIAEQAGLPKEVTDFFALAASGTTATYRSTIETTDANGKPLQVTTTQRPPDRRFDTFHADGTIDSTISVGGRSYQCAMAANHWDCGELARKPSTDSEVFGPTAVQGAIDGFRSRANDYDFRVDDQKLAGVAARCLTTTRKAGHEQDPSLGASARLCVSPEGAIVLVEVPSGSVAATEYTTSIPSNAFDLPAPVSSASSSAATTVN